jgi:small-conductance mechanosensitive channel/CRP-like cAMP-binding protein
VDALFDLAFGFHTPWCAGFVVLGAVFSRLYSSRERQRPRSIAVFMLVAHVVLLTVVGLGFGMHPPLPRELALVVVFTAGLAVLTMAVHLLFDVLLVRLRAALPLIVRDLSIIVLSLVLVLMSAIRLGFDLTGVVATSAVLTAVVGLSLQDTLGNILGGLSLQVDGSLSVGDWVQIGEVRGQVAQIGWRCTAIETNSWETVFVPNVVLMRNQVTVQGRRQGRPWAWRRSVRFHLPLGTPPAGVVAAIEHAVRAVEVPWVAVDPPPTCVCTGFDQGLASFAVRYWLTNGLHDESTDSRVRNLIAAAVARLGLELAAPGRDITQRDVPAPEGNEADSDKLRLVADSSLFRPLDPREQVQLAAALREWPLAPGEHLTRWGEEGDSLYFVASGILTVQVPVPDGIGDAAAEVARIGRGSVVGEMSLLTGEARSATITAVGDVRCYRLDRAAFTSVVRGRPDIIERLSAFIAERQRVNSEVLSRREPVARDEAGHASALSRMYRWLGLGSAS